MHISCLGELKQLKSQMKIDSEQATRVEQCVLELLKETKSMKQYLIQYNYHLRMDTVDISGFFPLQSNDDIVRFLQRDDEWIPRKKE